jgi:hypothetical protein
VLNKEGDFELRQYESYIVAETSVEGDFDDAGNIGFRRLFKYISGKNRDRQKIQMTAPVSLEPLSVKIPMSSPVGQEKAGKKWRITFLMPSDYSMDTLPIPLDDRIVLRQVPSQLMAALTYSGTWSRKRYDKKKEILKEKLRSKGFTSIGEDIFARYNSPFTLWFLRRNEVLIPIAQTEKIQ